MDALCCPPASMITSGGGTAPAGAGGIWMVAAARVSRGASRILWVKLSILAHSQALEDSKGDCTHPGRPSPHVLSFTFRGRCYHTLRWKRQHQHLGIGGKTASRVSQETLKVENSRGGGSWKNSGFMIVNCSSDSQASGFDLEAITGYCRLGVCTYM